MSTNHLVDNITEVLSRLNETARDELQMVVALSDAIRQADEQLLREVRSVNIQHEIRRDEILMELHTLATRLCALPNRPMPPRMIGEHDAQAALPHHNGKGNTHDDAAPRRNGHAVPPPLASDPSFAGGNWREATQRIDDELQETFGAGLPRH